MKPWFSLHRALIFIILLLVACLSLYPLIYMAASSLKTSMEFIEDPAGLPKTLYFDNFKALFYRFDVLLLFGNTAVCVAGGLVITLAVSIPASFAFAKLRFRWRSALYIILIATMTIPGITFLIPNYLLMSKLGWIDHFISVIVIWGVTSIPGNVFLLTSLMRGMPNELLEAVKIDGGNYWHLMGRIVLPMSIPGIMTVGIFNATGWWNDLLTPLIYLQSDATKTMTVAVATILGRFSSDYPLLLTGLLLTSIPPILIYILLQGFIRKGLVIGAVK
ncbi:carbohydrate ABC transporter permease [Paenibacillus mendelii]|uniref:Carbohydrate ABC transporter permease n=1 Tax=Paenibacillus mendelii TaxID=206163 RepID=A0ABV6J846_9BACL|nr:carbohydrate ABC transporter permease [Paenibacillus mendelii]MCQ6564038.1 carbohydrate ABC transporter permease [Paenibacillus mendelii]